jgi:hypothetical protein
MGKLFEECIQQLESPTKCVTTLIRKFINSRNTEQASCPTFNSTTRHAEWNTRQDLVQYRLNGSRSHILVDIQQIPEMLGIRNIDGLVRRLCKYCLCSVRNKGK